MKKATALLMALSLSAQIICSAPGIVSAADFTDAAAFAENMQEPESGTMTAADQGSDSGSAGELDQGPENDDVEVWGQENGEADGADEIQGEQTDVEVFGGPDSDGSADVPEASMFDDGVEEAEEFSQFTSQGTAEVKGSIKVELLSAVVMSGVRSFTVELAADGQAGDNPSAGSREITLAGVNESGVPSGTAVFTDLDAGNYTLRVKSPGFAVYSQTFHVNSMDYKIQLYTGILAGISYDAGAHPGAMLLGDVDQDGSVKDADKEIILNAIKTGIYTTQADLNLDGIVDIMDLHYFAKGLAQGRAYPASVESSVPVSAAKMVVPEGTKVEGSLGSPGAAEGTVRLSNKNDSAPISTENPVSVDFDFTENETGSAQMGGIALASPSSTQENGNAVASGTITIVTASDPEQSIEIPFSNGSKQQIYLLTDSSVLTSPTASVEPDGTIVINFNGQIAVKKVTIKITGTKLNTSLAEVSEVTFVNDMAERIPAPQMNIPTNLKAEPGSRQFSLQWDSQVNVTGYEVKISDGETEVVKKTSATSLTVKSFADQKLENNKIYEVAVQSVNGEWRSGYSETVPVTPKASQKPDAPDNLKVTGGYKSFKASWKDMKDTDSYKLYYRKESDQDYTMVGNLATNTCSVSGLEDNTRYFVYVTGVNELGESAPSLESVVSTINLETVQMPAYKLLNTSRGEGVLTSHIEKITRGRGVMQDSPLDAGTEKTAYGIADDSLVSGYFMSDWDDGAVYPSINGKGFIITLDDAHEMGSLSFVDTSNQGSYDKVVLDYWEVDETGAGGWKSVNTSVATKTDANNKAYYYVKFSKPVKTNKIHIALGKPHAYIRSIQVSELRLFYYDSLEDDIMNLYEDELHTTLKETVTEAVIGELQNRLDTKDSVSGEYHPEREMLQKELDTANGILKGRLKATVGIHGEIRASDGYLGFTGLNAWQPLGVSARAGETLTIYVGNPSKKTGASAEMNLYVTQTHAEASAFMSKAIPLKVGRNEVTVPAIQSIAAEQGGQIYVQYTGNQNGVHYGVRVEGGVSIPRLDLYGLSGEERTNAITAYVEELEAYVPKLQEEHEKLHNNAEYPSVNYAYDQNNCILNTTDIMLDQMMYSVPASQILNGLGEGSTEVRVQKLDSTLKAMEDMMLLFYQHKGLTNASDAGAKNKLPARHLNIRYMRMFKGAFMYASGNHVGIEWGSVPGLMNSQPVVSNNGKYESGRYFGWGIAHEIGHEINQGAYAIAEITNNYFSVLAQAKDTNDSVRFNYKDVYEKVTSGAVGRADNVFVQLAMYWQLHLAYDRGYNYKTYDTYGEIFKNLFFARVDSYARDTSKAPSPNGVKLTLSNTDQNLMRLASAAAERDLSEFFERWGMVPDKDTLAYMKQFAPEERAIYYVNDEARVYEIENGTGSSFKGKDTVQAQVSVDGTTARLDMSVSENDKNALLGFEIYRCTNAKGVIHKELAGFTTDGTYLDSVISQANRVVTYEVAAVDKFLCRSASISLNPVKIASDGRYAKTGFTVSVVNMTSSQDKVQTPDEENPDVEQKIPAIDMVIDDDLSTTYQGSVTGKGQIIIDFHKTLAASALLYECTNGTPIQNYRIQLSGNGEKWFTVKEGKFEMNAGKSVVYFQNEARDPRVATFDVRYLKLEILNPGECSISELEILGPSGDNLEFSKNGAAGILKEDYVYAENEKIAKGSLVFTGTYKGNPAYNVVVLYDEEGNVVGGMDSDGTLRSVQVILAQVPEHGELGEISEGSWVYYIPAENLNAQITLPSKVRAELYRVDNAQTNEGERLVSDTTYLELSKDLPEIVLK
ncbi:M60 family metallopeptidase [Blautia schinkii]|nr:M60 family metallopeptidase [Blautia schinkii]